MIANVDAVATEPLLRTITRQVSNLRATQPSPKSTKGSAPSSTPHPSVSVRRWLSGSPYSRMKAGFGARRHCPDWPQIVRLNKPEYYLRMTSMAQSAGKSEVEMMALGMRKITLWVPDTTSPEFEAEYRRQMAILSLHYKHTNFADLLEPDQDDVEGWI